ncbi:elongator complex protein 4 [Cryptococcus neoformans Bt63]|nr:elongator complex protein 4 [Cryptococcus neoformans var. grubii Bt63]
MPSFTRRIPAANPPPPGTTPSPIHSLPLLPTGLPSMDDLLGGGLPLHSILLVLAPDTQSAWGRLVERYWIAQGLASGQAGVLVGEKEEGEAVVKGCMWTEGGVPGDGSESEGEGGVEGGERKIAWRYEKMGKFQTTVKGNGSNLSLMTTIPPEALSMMQESGQMSYVAINSDEPSTSRSCVLDEMLKGVWEKLEHADKGRATRLAVHELGSLDWGNISMNEIHRFIHSVRELLKIKPASALITLPASLILSMGSERESIVKRLSWGVDACVELKGFADDPTLPPLFPTHGLLTLHSYPTTHALLPSTLKHSTLLGVSQSSTSASSSGGGGGAGENNLGFRLKRKRFVVETVHLGVEGGVGERRTGGDVREALDGADATHSHTHSHPTLTVPSSGIEPSQSALASTSRARVDDKPRGADQDKKPLKPRARVRFGGEEEVIVVGKGGDEVKHDHAHSHTHDHGPQGKDQPPKIALRHDRPDLYEF